MKDKKALATIAVGEGGKLLDVSEVGAVRQRLSDLGFSVGQNVRCVGESPLGDPVMLVVGGKVVAVRRCDLKNIYTES